MTWLDQGALLSGGSQKPQEGTKVLDAVFRSEALLALSHAASKPIKAAAIVTRLNCCSALSSSSLPRLKLKLGAKAT